MSRFPVLTIYGYILRGAAILFAICAVIALIAAKGSSRLFDFVGFLFLALILEIVYELSTVVLSIEDNTHSSRQSLERLVQLLDGASTPNMATRGSFAEEPPRFSPTVISKAERSTSASNATLEENPGSIVNASVDEVPELSDSMPDFETDSTELPIVDGRQTKATHRASLAFDKNPSTYWATTGSELLRSAYASFDLGSPFRISEIAWMFAKKQEAVEVKVQVSKNHFDWWTVATLAGVLSTDWQSVKCHEDAKYVRFLFQNPGNLPTFGYLREVRIFK